MTDPSVLARAVRAEHIALSYAFEERCRELRLEPDPLLFWYHTIDLGNGLVTPGSFDYRSTINEFALPDTMSGMTALDIGSATGFFTFEMERRGASVTSVELPALSRWDCFPGESTSGIIAKIRDRLPYHSIRPLEEIAASFQRMSEVDLYRVLLDGPFQFCRHVLNSQVERVYSTIYELPNHLRERRRFDLVMLGDILIHSIEPLRAIAAAASLCGGLLIIADDILGAEDDSPAMYYVGGSVAGSDIAEWWRPNLSFYRQVLTRLGFKEVRLVSSFAGTVRPGGELLNKRVLHARR